MVSSVNNTMQMQQMQNMQGAGRVRGMHNAQGKGMGQLMKALPQDERENLQKTLQSMDQTQRKDVVTQLKQLDVSSLSQEDLMNEIQNILNPNSSSQTASLVANSFSIYA